MPGGKGKIRPEDGKQFSSDYQPQRRWSEENALKVGQGLLKWMREKPTNIFWEEFLYIDNDYYSELISYLCQKFTSFSKLIAKAKKIQEIKLKKYGAVDKLNATITKFVLINEHGWRDKQVTELEFPADSETLRQAKERAAKIVDEEKD